MRCLQCLCQNANFNGGMIACQNEGTVRETGGSLFQTDSIFTNGGSVIVSRNSTAIVVVVVVVVFVCLVDSQCILKRANGQGRIVVNHNGIMKGKLRQGHAALKRR